MAVLGQKDRNAFGRRDRERKVKEHAEAAKRKKNGRVSNYTLREFREKYNRRPHWCR